MNRIPRLFGAALIIVCISILFWESFSFAPRDALWPQGIIVGLFALCILYIASPDNKEKSETTTRRESSAGPLRVLGTILLTVAYLFVCEWLGYYVTTALFLLALLLLLGERSWVVLTVLPAATTFAIYGVFFLFLRIPLPSGMLF